MARAATANPETSVIPIKRTTPEIAEKIYMPREVSPYLLRAELDQLKDRFNEQATELQRIHNTQNAARSVVEKDVKEIQLTMVELVGRNGQSGMVYSHKGQLKTLFTKTSDLKAKYWQLAAAGVSIATAAAAVGKFFL